jgi:hypothetical protein
MVCQSRRATLDDLRDNDEHEDEELSYIQLPVYKEMEMELVVHFLLVWL